MGGRARLQGPANLVTSLETALEDSVQALSGTGLVRASAPEGRLSSSASRAEPDIKGHAVPKILGHTRKCCSNWGNMCGEDRRHGKAKSRGGDIGLACEGWLGVCWAGKGIQTETSKSQGPEE